MDDGKKRKKKRRHRKPPENESDETSQGGLAGQRSLLENQHSPTWYARKKAARYERMRKDQAQARTENPRITYAIWPATLSAPWDYKEWKAIGILGNGSSGICGLWEYQGTISTPELKHGTRIAIKRPMYDNNTAMLDEFQREIDKMLKLNKRESQHLVKMLIYREPDSIYLEYLEGGHLWSALNQQITNKYPYPEEQLWRLFLCLAKGMLAMSMLDTEKGWWPFLHLDFKPNNLFYTKDSNHDCPGSDFLFKIGDFGLSAELEGYHDGWKLEDDQRTAYKGNGHVKFRTPEQLCEEWMWDDWQKSEICGNWSPKVNVWALGAIIWQMAMLEVFPPRVYQGFDRDQRYVSGLDPKLSNGPTYGKELESSDYSNELKILILWCMMEHPKHRPEPSEVVKIIEDHLGHSAGSSSGPSAGMAQAEPETPV